MSLTSAGLEHIARHLYRSDRVHAALPRPDRLTDEHIRHYHEHGYLAFENVFSTEEIESAKAGLSRLILGEVPEFKEIDFEAGIDVTGMSLEKREHYVRKIMWFVDHEPRLKAMSAHPMLSDMVQQLVGNPVRMIQDMALVKPAKVGREKPWHQDGAYFMLSPLNLIIGCWIALDDATVENGCMHVIPASHLKGGRPHYHDRDCQLPDDDVEVQSDVVIPLKPGGVLFFNGLIHHGTPPNRSPNRRRAIQFHYAATHCRQTTPEEHAESFHDSHGRAACTAMKARSIAERF